MAYGAQRATGGWTIALIGTFGLLICKFGGSIEKDGAQFRPGQLEARIEEDRGLSLTEMQ